MKTKSGSPSCHRADYLFDFEGRFCHLRCINRVPFSTYYGRLCTSGSTESNSIWNSRALSNLNSSTSDFVDSFSFVDELYNATFVKDLRTPNHFLRNLLIKLFIFFQFSKVISCIFAWAMLIMGLNHSFFCNEVTFINGE